MVLNLRDVAKERDILDIRTQQMTQCGSYSLNPALTIAMHVLYVYQWEPINSTVYVLTCIYITEIHLTCFNATLLYTHHVDAASHYQPYSQSRYIKPYLVLRCAQMQCKENCRTCTST